MTWGTTVNKRKNCFHVAYSFVVIKTIDQSKKKVKNMSNIRYLKKIIKEKGGDEDVEMEIPISGENQEVQEVHFEKQRPKRCED